MMIPPKNAGVWYALTVGESGLSKKKKPYLDAREFVNRQIEQRTNAALKQKNARFAIEHAHDTEEQLLSYLRSCAQELGRTPDANEIIGGAYIAHRFGGSYMGAVFAAGLSKPESVATGNARRIYQRELKVQARLYKREKAELQVQRRAEREERARIAQQKLEARRKRDSIWGEAHKHDTDAQLIAYVQSCAKKLGHTPYTREVEGGEYIRKRFCGWSVCLTMAGLPLPADLKAPQKKQMNEYLRNQNADR